MLKKFLSFCSIVIFVLLTVSCREVKEYTPNPPLLDSDIKVGGVITSPSEYWLTHGDVFSISIVGTIDFASSKEGVILSSVRMEKDGDIIGQTKYTPNCSISAKVDNWSHGENEIKLYAVFTYIGQEVVKEISKTKVLVFNELPKYNIEGCAISEVLWVDQKSGNPYYHIMVINSNNHIFKYYFDFLDVDPLSGESYRWDRLSNVKTVFFFDEKETNFNAEITNEELHWRTHDGPAGLNEELGDKEILYVDFTIEGEHEGIKITRNPTISFWFIREPE